MAQVTVVDVLVDDGTETEAADEELEDDVDDDDDEEEEEEHVALQLVFDIDDDCDAELAPITAVEVTIVSESISVVSDLVVCSRKGGTLPRRIDRRSGD